MDVQLSDGWKDKSEDKARRREGGMDVGWSCSINAGCAGAPWMLGCWVERGSLCVVGVVGVGERVKDVVRG